MLKKTTLAVLGLVYSGFLAAGMYSAPPVPTCAPGDVSVPCDAKKWALGIQALYLKPAYSDSLTFQPSVIDGLKEIDPRWGWGYRLEGAYFFNTGNDITMNYLHYNVRSHLGSFDGQYLQLLQQGAVVLPSVFTETLSNRFDQINLVMGQHVDFGMQKSARFYAGMQYAKIRLDGNQYFNRISPVFIPSTKGVSAVVNTDFNGFGPSVGVDYSYTLVHGVNLIANTMGSLLLGTSRFDASTSYGSGLVVTSTYGAQRKIVPSVELKLGANYSREMMQGVLSIEGGYQAVNYFDALRAQSVVSNALSTSDFGLYGPYFGVKWLGNA